MAIWRLKNNKTDVTPLMNALKLNEVSARLLVNRGVTSKADAKKFINPLREHMEEFGDITNTDKAIDILKDSIAKNDKIVIYGDYDADGVMSTVILYKGLETVCNNLSYYIPHREKEGYGLNKHAINTLHSEGVNLIVACDNGISAIDEVEYAKSLGINIIIIDHHESTKIGENEEILPPADAIINPKQLNCTYPFKHMCAAALCYKFIYAFHDKKDNFDELFIFASIATFCDVVDLIGENRAIAYIGQQLINKSVTNIGLLALMKEKLVKIGAIDESTMGFTLGPCINAAGRLKTADIAVELFLSDDEEKAKTLAKELSELNEERKNLTRDATYEIEEEFLPKYVDDNIVVIYVDTIHESIAGIVAGRLKDNLYKPVIVLTKSTDDMAKGSARSVEGCNIFEEISKHRHLLDRFGGHEMAAGLSIPTKNIDEFRTLLNKEMSAEIKEEVILIEKELPFEEVTFNFAQQLNYLRPFGKNNLDPIFGTKNVEVIELKIKGEKNTILFTFKTQNCDRPIKGIYFGDVSKIYTLIETNFQSYDAEKIANGIFRTAKFFLDIVYSIGVNQYNGVTSLQLRVKDFRYPGVNE